MTCFNTFWNQYLSRYHLQANNYYVNATYIQMTPKRGHPFFANLMEFILKLSPIQNIACFIYWMQHFQLMNTKISLLLQSKDNVINFFSYPLKICGHTIKPFRYYFDQVKSPSKDREKQKFTYISVQASLSLLILLYISCKSIEFNPL